MSAQCLLPVASSGVQQARRAPQACRHAQASRQGNPRRPAMQLSPTAMRPLALLSRHSEYMGSRLAVHLGRQVQLRRQNSGLQIQASFFGVGAPEAVLVGLVALVIFGPQGLAQAAKTAGSTLKAFKPTLDELSTVSQDLRKTFDEELGINEIRNEFRSVGSSFTSPSRGTQQPDWDDMGTTMTKRIAPASSSQDSSEADPDIDSKRAQSAELAWGKSAEAQEPQQQQRQQQDGTSGSADKLTGVSLDQLQAELARRRAAKNDSSST